MFRVKQHIPGFVDGLTPKEATVDAADKIKEIDFVKSHAAPTTNTDDPFVRFSVSYGSQTPYLMAEHEKTFWVIAYLYGGTKENLSAHFPEWVNPRKPNADLAQLAEYPPCKREVIRSNRIVGTNIPRADDGTAIVAGQVVSSDEMEILDLLAERGTGLTFEQIVEALQDPDKFYQTRVMGCSMILHGRGLVQVSTDATGQWALTDKAKEAYADEGYLVCQDRNFYPDIYFHPTLVEAEKGFEETFKEQHDPAAGTKTAHVFLVKVIKKTPFKSHGGGGMSGLRLYDVLEDETP